MKKNRFLKIILLTSLIIGIAPIFFQIRSILKAERNHSGTEGAFSSAEAALDTEKNISEELKYPSNLLMMDDIIAHHVILVEKSTHKLHIFANTDHSQPQYIKSFPIATGLTEGDKSSQGDFKTPEGIYQLADFLTAKELLRRYGQDAKQYGAGAFVTTYPNPIDVFRGKTGGGIWLHSTNDESRILKGLDSKGCVVVGNKELKDISRYIELNSTTIIIVQDLLFLREETWKKNRDSVEKTVGEWLEAWKRKDINKYLSFYHDNYKDNSRRSKSAFSAYKKAVFSKNDRPEINISSISALSTDEYMVVQFVQDYKSAAIRDIGKKTLYLVKDQNYHWKIVTETWSKFNEKARIAFTPSLRFFED